MIRQSFIGLEERIERLLRGSVRWMLGGQGGYEIRVRYDSLQVSVSEIAPMLVFYKRKFRLGKWILTYDLSFTISGSQHSSILGGCGCDASVFGS